jgi:hypothetical protein
MVHHFPNASRKSGGPYFSVMREPGPTPLKQTGRSGKTDEYYGGKSGIRMKHRIPSMESLIKTKSIYYKSVDIFKVKREKKKDASRMGASFLAQSSG